MPMRNELTDSRTKLSAETAADREFWIIVIFCTIGFAATMYLFNHLPILLSEPILWG